jgi:hypothetical protein
MRISTSFQFAAILSLVLLVAACDTGDRRNANSGSGFAQTAAPTDTMFAAIDSVALRRHIETLSSDEFEGRGTGTRGEELTIQYIRNEMERIGLEGGMPDGSFYQRVPLIGSTATRIGNLRFTPDDGQPRDFRFVEQFIASTDHDATSASIDGELVFVGYGIQSDVYNWDDYKDLDVTGKILIGFVNDPPATADDPNLFQGDTLTYAGRWTYKYEEARRRGAVGMFLIHTDEMAGYPFTVLSNGARGEQIRLAETDEAPLDLKGWITEPTARSLAEMSGTTLDAWKEEARTREFQPQELPVRAALEMEFETRRFEGTSVIGKITGNERPNEAIVFTAHHDHLGIDEDAQARGEDGIYSGATDNASGVAMVLAVADAFTRMENRPAGSLLFMTLTAEENGLLGSQYYTENPVIPMAHTIANINLDSGNLFGRTQDIVGIGAERSDMEVLLREAAREEDMTVSPDVQPGQGLFYRSDQLHFARNGVPAIFVNTGSQFIGQDASYAERVMGEYRQTRYHQPSDTLAADTPMGGLIQQTRVALRLGHRLATTDIRPQWKAGEDFGEARRRSEQEAGIRR